MTDIVCSSTGVDLTKHIRRQVRREDLEQADVIVVTAESHWEAVLAGLPALLLYIKEKQMAGIALCSNRDPKNNRIPAFSVDIN